MNNSLNTIKNIEVTSITGEILFTNSSETDSVSLEDFPSGIYDVKVKAGDQVYVKKLAVSK